MKQYTDTEEITNQNKDSSENTSVSEPKNTDSNPKDNPSIPKPSHFEEDEYKEDALEFATMTIPEKIKYKKELQKKRLSKMDTKEKRSYIIGYYKWHFIIGLFALVCLGYIGHLVYRATWPTYVELAIVNNKDETKLNEYIPTAYREYYHLDEKNYIEIYNDLSVSANEDTTEVGLTMSSYQTLGYYTMYDMLDVIICDKEALKLFVSTDDTTAIDISMDQELYNQIEDYVITMSDPKGIKNEGKPYAVALDITETEFAKNCHLSYYDVYLLIPSTKYENNENTINFIKFVFGL